MNALIRVSTTALLVLFLPGCGKQNAEADAAVPVALVVLQPAAKATLREVLTAYGTSEFSASDAVTLSLQAEARVVAVLVTAGAEVKVGQPLLRLVPTPATRLEVAAARRDAAQTEQERLRQQRLRDEGLATEGELAAAINAAATAKALSSSLDARVGSSDDALIAPRAGIVDELSAQVGDVLAPGTTALRIASPEALQLRLGVQPEDAARVRAGQSVTLTPLAAGSMIIESSVASVDRRVDPQTRLIAAVVHLAPGKVLPGAVLRGNIVVATHADVIAIPSAALLFEGDQPYAFVAVDGRAQKRKLKTGLRDGDRIEISSGLALEEAVVVAGNAVLEDGMAVRTQAGDEAANDATAKNQPRGKTEDRSEKP